MLQTLSELLSILGTHDFNSLVQANSCGEGTTCCACVLIVHIPVEHAGAVHPAWVGFGLQIDFSGRRVPLVPH